MKQADKRALEAYPIDSYEGHDDMYRQRGAFAKGYEQAEKDLMKNFIMWVVNNGYTAKEAEAVYNDFKHFMGELI